MSTNPIIIEIIDKIDSSIAGKITAIGTAARQASTDLTNLQAAITTVSGGTTKLSVALKEVNAPLQEATRATSGFEFALANLIGRAGGAAAGMGMLGGAFARTAAAAGAAVPLIIAALAVAPIAAYLLYQYKAYEASQKLSEANATWYNHLGNENDKLLTLKETYAGLVDGPMAKYALMLADLSKRSVVINISDINKTLDEQKSKLADVVSLWERITAATKAMGTYEGQKQGATGNALSGDYNIAGAEKFITAQHELQAVYNSQGKGQEGLQIILKNTEDEMKKWAGVMKDETGVSLSITQVGLDGIRKLHTEELNQLALFHQEKKNDQLLADGKSLEQMKKAADEQMKAFNEELISAKEQGLAVTAEQERAIREAQLSGAQRASLIGPAQPADEQNIFKLKKDIYDLTQEIDHHGERLDKLIEKYNAAIAKVGAYSTAAKVAAEVEKLTAQTDSVRNPLSQSDNAKIQAAAEAGVKAQEDQKAALIIRDYNLSLQAQIDLLGKYGDALKIETQIETVRKALQKDNRDLSSQEIEDYRQKLTSMEQQKLVQSEMTALWNANEGAVKKNIAVEIALRQALDEHVISLGQEKIALLGIELAQNKLNNDMGKGDFASHMIQILGTLVNTTETTSQKLTVIWGSFFKSLDKGFADSIAKWMVGTESLGKALLDVARNAVASLISSLIQLGIELLLIDALSQIPALKKLFDMMNSGAGDTTKQTAKNTAVALAAIAVLTAAEFEAINLLSGPAWSLAEAVSIFSFGAADALATVGIEAVKQAGAGGAGGLLSLAGGGPVSGPGGTDRVPAWLTDGEFVVNAKATAQNRSTLEQMNRGVAAVSSTKNNAGASVGGRMLVSVVHDGSTAIAVQQIDEHTVRVIAKQESRAAVSQYAPAVISSDLQNPNSKTSKAVNLNVVAPRRR
jgi:hypothetical protein